jgi:hypothetical protein
MLQYFDLFLAKFDQIFRFFVNITLCMCVDQLNNKFVIDILLNFVYDVNPKNRFKSFPKKLIGIWSYWLYSGIIKNQKKCRRIDKMLFA